MRTCRNMPGGTLHGSNCSPSTTRREMPFDGCRALSVRLFVTCGIVLNCVGDLSAQSSFGRLAQQKPTAQPAATNIEPSRQATVKPELSQEPPAVEAADPETAADDRPGTKVAVSLDDGIFQRRLPFDVPFYLTGKPPDFATDMAMTAFRTPSKAVLTEIASQLRDTTNCVPDTKFGVRTVSRSSWKGKAGASEFVLLVDALDPQRYYVFCFLSRGLVAPSEIEASAREILSQVTVHFLGPSAPTASGDVSVELAKGMHERLAQRITELGAVRAVPAVIPEGNIFHASTPIERGTPFVKILSRLIQPYSRLLARETDYNSRFKGLQAALDNAPESAKPFLIPAITGSLPPAQLPRRELAITSRAPFDFKEYDFTDVSEMLAEAETAARQKNENAAAEAIAGIHRHVGALQDMATAFGRNYEDLRDAAQQAVDRVALEAREVRVGIGSSVLTADMNRNAYVSLDTGMAYTWQLESMVFYAGTNVYFRPINKNAPLRLKGSFGRRFALTIGVTTSVKDASRRAQDLRPATGEDGTNSLLLGGGLRVTPSIRVGAGALIFNETDPNPLITQKSVAATPYVSLAVDINLGALLKNFFPGQ
ncbi:MAG: hypothetical protein WBC51_26520 [Vicinamibacterales bacterium]